MSDRETILQIRKIMKRILLLPYGGCGEIAPRKGTTRRECYRALWEIQELVEARKLFYTLPPQTNADRIRAMSDEELAEKFFLFPCVHVLDDKVKCKDDGCKKCWMRWLREECKNEN